MSIIHSIKSHHPLTILIIIPILTSIILFIWIQSLSPTPTTTTPTNRNLLNESPPKTTVKHFKYKIITSIPHPSHFFTQGLTFRSSDGALLEGTGLEGQSAMYVWEMDSLSSANNNPIRPHPTKTFKLPNRHFGEGIAEYRGRLYQLTWRNGKIYVINADTFSLITTLDMPSQLAEGWGACVSPGHDALLFSDGSARIFWYSVSTDDTQNTKLTHLRSVEIRDCSSNTGKVIGGLNELEIVPLRVTHPEEAVGGGFFSNSNAPSVGALVWANIYGSSCVVMADPISGFVRGYLHLDGLNPTTNEHQNVYNGIAFRNLDESIWVTGKTWTQLHKIELVEVVNPVEIRKFAPCSTIWNAPLGNVPKTPYQGSFTCPKR
jgi:glutamine cyclotransferase